MLPLGTPADTYRKKSKTVKSRKLLWVRQSQMRKYWLSNKKVSVQHCFVLRTEFNKCQILVALWAVKTCRQAAIMSWRKNPAERGISFFSCSFPLLRSIPDAELWISCSWAQPAGSHCNQQRETRVHLPSPPSRASLCLGVPWIVFSPRESTCPLKSLLDIHSLF